MGRKAVAPLAYSDSTIFTGLENNFDPALASLFAKSSGPVTAAKQAFIEPSQPPSLSQDDEEAASLDGSNAIGSDLSGQKDEFKEQEARPRKRRRLSDENLESEYLNRLAREEEIEQSTRQKHNKNAVDHDDMSSEGDSDGAESVSDQSELEMFTQDVDTPMHETLDGSKTEYAENKAKRTVFLGNISTEAIKSKSAKKTLLSHLTSTLKDGLKIESIRFRSTAFASDAGPKMVAYAKRELMDQTTKSTNAYVIYSDDIAARKSASKLNGTIVLGRHLRADYLAEPSSIDHRRCVFVGNLSFVGEETLEIPNESDEKARQPKGKEPADAEEGLWRTFSKAGKVENVRVIRDKETRVGKGFAYVQFFNENAVESALLMNEKKFPPMLPRKLRVMRAKRTRQKPTFQSSREKTSGRSSGRKVANGQERSRTQRGSGKPGSGAKRPESFIFEGQRASSSAIGKDRDSRKKKRRVMKPDNRSSRRAAAFEASGGKRKRLSE